MWKAKKPGLKADLVYLKPMTDRPQSYADEPPSGVQRTNCAFEAKRKTILSMRALPDAGGIDQCGFTLLKRPVAVKNFYDDKEVQDVYYADIRQLLKSVMGATEVFVFDHRQRRRPDRPEPPVAGGPRQPIWQAHVDYTDRSGPEFARTTLPLGTETNERIRIVNLWRPLHGPLHDAPLAVCDSRTVGEQDLVETDLIYPDKVWQIYSVTANPAHQWYYAPQMTPDEVLLFKSFDSETDGRARFTPHAAFENPAAPPRSRPRESIEARALIIG